MALKVDMGDKTAYSSGGGRMGSGRLYFFRSVFENGNILAFYSDSPWGRCYDMEKGWVVINPKTKDIVDEVATKSMGWSTGDFRPWRKEMREKHGKTKKVFRDDLGNLIWKNDG